MTFAHYAIGWQYDGTPSAKLVLLAIAEHADPTGLAYPGYTRLANLTGLHRSTVVRCVSELEDRGVVKVERTTRDGKTRNRYTLVAQCDQSHDATSRTGQHDWSQDATGVVAPRDTTSRTVIPEPPIEPPIEPINESLRELPGLHDT